MSSELQRDIDLVQATIAWGAESAAPFEAWNRLKPRLTPDRERVARAIAKAVYVSDDAVEDPKRGTKGYLFWLPAADAAIDAMEGNDGR